MKEINVIYTVGNFFRIMILFSSFELNNIQLVIVEEYFCPLKN
jgi:hypothetical protein